MVFLPWSTMISFIITTTLLCFCFSRSRMLKIVYCLLFYCLFVFRLRAGERTNEALMMMMHSLLLCQSTTPRNTRKEKLAHGSFVLLS
jgi:hypothetical protein